MKEMGYDSDGAVDEDDHSIAESGGHGDTDAHDGGEKSSGRDGEAGSHLGVSSRHLLEESGRVGVVVRGCDDTGAETRQQDIQMGKEPEVALKANVSRRDVDETGQLATVVQQHTVTVQMGAGTAAADYIQVVHSHPGPALFLDRILSA